MPKGCSKRTSRCAKASAALIGLFGTGAGVAGYFYSDVLNRARSLMSSTVKIAGFSVQGEINNVPVTVKNVKMTIPVPSALSDSSREMLARNAATISSVETGIQVVLVIAVGFLIAKALREYVCQNSKSMKSEQNEIADLERGEFAPHLRAPFLAKQQITRDSDDRIESEQKAPKKGMKSSRSF